MASFDPTASAALAALAGASLKATVLLVLASLAVLAVRRRSAALKHLLWAVGLGATLVVAALPSLVPAWRVVPTPRLDHELSRVAMASFSEGGAERRAPLAELTPSTATDPTGPDVSAETRVVLGHAPSLVFGLWLMGGLVVLVRYGVSVAMLSRLLRRATPLGPSPWGRLAESLAAQMGIACAVHVVSSADIDMPLSWGLVRPHVVLPAEAVEWDPSRRRHVLGHELAHVSRRDAWTQCLAQAASAIFWFHPLVWHASRALQHQRERACDDCVLAQGVVASEYANDLLALAAPFRPFDRGRVALAMARPSEVEGRLVAVLDPALPRTPVSRLAVTAVVLVAGLLVVPLSALRGEARAVARPPAPPVAADPVRVAPAAVDPRPVAPPPVVPHRAPGAARALGGDPFASCGTPTAVHSHFDDDGASAAWTVTAESEACRLSLDASGRFAFNAEATGLVRLSPGGSFDLSTTIRGTTDRLIVRGTASGLTYAFTHNGVPAAFVPETTPWWPAALLALDRDTAFAVDERLPILLGRGPGAVLDEVERMSTSHSKGVYLLALVDRAPLDEAALERVVAASRTLPADQIVRLFRRTLAGDAVPDTVLRSMFDLVGQTPDDQNKAQMLYALIGRTRLDPPMRDLFRAAASTIRDERLRTRVMQSVGRR